MAHRNMTAKQQYKLAYRAERIARGEHNADRASSMFGIRTSVLPSMLVAAQHAFEMATDEFEGWQDATRKDLFACRILLLQSDPLPNGTLVRYTHNGEKRVGMIYRYQGEWRGRHHYAIDTYYTSGGVAQDEITKVIQVDERVQTCIDANHWMRQWLMSNKVVRDFVLPLWDGNR